MKNHIKKIVTDNVGKLKTTGFFSIFLSNVFAKIITLIGGVVLVRVLSKSGYGLYTDVLNNYGILFILNDFGCCVAMMQYRCENYNDKTKSNDYFTKAFLYGLAASAVASLLLFFSPWFYPFKHTESVQLTQALFLLPFITTANCFLQSNLRVLLKNTRFAVLNIITTIIHYGVLLPMSYYFELPGAVIANYGIAILTLIVSIGLSRDTLLFDWKSDVLSKKEKKDFLKFAIGSQLNNSIGGMLNLFDIFLISLIVINSESIASYKVASTIPLALIFIPNSIIIYIIPFFARNINNRIWVRTNYKKVLVLTSAINGALTMFGVVLSPYIIPLIYGPQYVDAIPCFIILMIAFFFNGSLYIPTANIIYTQHKVRANIIITIISNIVNCLMDVILIRNYGSIGAAYSTLIVSFVATVASIGYMMKILKEEVD